MTGDCVGVDIAKAGRLLQQKPAYGGNIVSVIMGATTPQLATVRARMYEPLEPREGLEADVEYLRPGSRPPEELRIRTRESHEDSNGVGIHAADTVVVAGPAFDAVAELSALPGAIGGTYDVCATGLLPRRLEVGLYGHAIAPRLLIALGLDGRTEDLAGFVKAAVVVSVGSVRTDWADVAVAGDWRELVPRLAPLGAG